MKAVAIVVLSVLAGCAHTSHTTQPVRRPLGPVYKRQMSPAMKEAVMTLVYMKSDPNVYKIREKDPFRRQ